MTLTKSESQEVTLRAGPLVNLPELVHSLGHDPHPLFQSCGFQLQQFQNTENRLPFIQTGKLFAHCVEITGAEHLGLLLGQMASASHLGLAGFLLQCAPTVDDALHALALNLDLHDQGGVVTLDIGPSHSSLGYSLVLPNVAGSRQVYDLSAVMMHNIMRSICGKDWHADSISLERRHPADTAPYQKFFDTQIYFDAAETALTFSSSWLKLTSQGSDPLLYRHLSEEARFLHESYCKGLLEELPVCLHRALLSGQFNSRQVASSLGIHERTLHRRLKAAGTSFRHELDGARQTLSQQLLSSTSLPVCDIADSLGYSDSSGFIRAFQRWCGSSPSAWRRQQLAVSDNSKKTG